MAGAVDSVTASGPDADVHRLLTGLAQRLTLATGPVMMNSVLLDVDLGSGKTLSIERLDRMEN